jgi:thimet oligopeptidase
MHTMIAFPANADDWPTFLTDYVHSRLATARETSHDIGSGLHSEGASALARWNEGDIALAEALALVSLIAESHVDEEVRTLAGTLMAAAEEVQSRRSQDPRNYAALSSIDPDTLQPAAADLLARTLTDFRAQGAHLEADLRGELATISDRITALSISFSENIRNARGSIRIAPERLAGLPQDFIDAHPAGDDGLVEVTTDYPDLLPFTAMAHDAAARAELMRAARMQAYPENEAVLKELLHLRHRKATMLGFADYPSYATETMMMPSGDHIGVFIDDVAAAAKPAGERDAQRLISLAQETDPSYSQVGYADHIYLVERLKERGYGVDQQAVREYLDYDKVRDGILGLVTDLLALRFERRDDVTGWHEDVETYDVYDANDGDLLGRVRLDMHPREGKFGHAACFGVVPGVADHALPELALLCNFGRGLLTHDELQTFLHEFGHLVHFVLLGRHPFPRTSTFGDRSEWDFVEAPSQLLEEWAWDARVLSRFATNDAGEPIPTEMVQALTSARFVCEGLFTCRQLSLAATSYWLHLGGIEDLDAVEKRAHAAFDVRSWMEGVHGWASFGHLTDYSSNYYTYQWSLSIARDLWTGFNHADLLDPEPAMRYRRTVLEPGCTKPATELIQDFLGRPYSTDAYQNWLASL